MEDEINSLKKELDDVKRSKSGFDANSVKKMIDDQICKSLVKFISVEPSFNGPGILSTLRNKEKNKFNDRQFIASSSIADIYNLIDPNTKDYFLTSSDSNSYIEFELEKPITMSGLQIYVTDLYFPQSFDIEIDGTTVASIYKTNKLSKPFKMMTAKFSPKKGRAIKFIQKGPNSDKGNNFLCFKRFEIESTDPIYSNGVFSTLIQAEKNHDPHRCPVILSSLNFDFNTFTSIDTKQNISVPYDNPWFQIELTNGFAILTGFRLKRGDYGKLKSYKIVSTDDCKKSIDSWSTLIEIDEKTKDEHKLLDVYLFQKPSPPSRFVRIIMTGKNWNNESFLIFFNFDLFGSYF